MNHLTRALPAGSVPSQVAVYHRRWGTVLTAMAVANAGWAIAQPGAGVDLAVRLGPSGVQQVSLLATTLASLVAGFVAWALLTMLERMTSKARAVWTGIACVAFLVSLTGPLAATTPEATFALMGLHAVVAVILIVGMRRSRPATPGGQR